MEREEKLRGGVDERLPHLVIGDGSTVSEHVPALRFLSSLSKALE